MKYLFPVLLISLLLLSCRKDENGGPEWQQTLGRGEAQYIAQTPDSGIVACGNIDGKPYLVRFDRNRNKLSEIRVPASGTFSSAWIDTSSIITAGSNGHMLQIKRFLPDGDLVWEKTIQESFSVENTILFHQGGSSFLAIGSASADSLSAGDNGLLFVSFDTTGAYTSTKYISSSSIAAEGADVNSAGQVCVALTRKSPGSRTRSSVALFSSSFALVRETEIFNNPDFSSSALAVMFHDGDVLVSGRTEIPSDNQSVPNSYVARTSLTAQQGSVRWKKYLGFWNDGTDLSVVSGEVVILNRSCFILYRLAFTDGAETSQLRSFSVCEPKTSDAFAESLALSHDGKYLMAGSMGGNFYIAVKHPSGL